MAHRNRWFTLVYLLKMVDLSMAMLVITRLGKWAITPRLGLHLKGSIGDSSITQGLDQMDQWIGYDGSPGKHAIDLWEDLWFPIDFPLNQSIEWNIDGI